MTTRSGENQLSVSCCCFILLVKGKHVMEASLSVNGPCISDVNLQLYNLSSLYFTF